MNTKVLRCESIRHVFVEGDVGTEDVVRQGLLRFLPLADTGNATRFFSNLVSIFGFSLHKQSNFYFCIFRNKILPAVLWCRCFRE